MKVAKLSTGKIVRLDRIAQVGFTPGQFALVYPQLRSAKAWSNNPYWVPSSQIVWVLSFNHPEDED